MSIFHRIIHHLSLLLPTLILPLGSIMNTRVIHTIKDFFAGYTSKNTDSGIWQDPLIAFAAADDPLFELLKTVVGPTHATPADLLPSARTVIVYFLPFHQEIPKSNRNGKDASPKWADAYVQTNQLIINLNHHLATFFQQSGFRSKLLPPTHNFDTKSLISDWSHKHVAYIAGLGNFGFHHQLITAKGCCGRLGSLITEAPLTKTERPEMAFCLNRFDNSCRICQQRCPVGALTESGLNRQDCYQVLLHNAARYSDLGLAEVCGKCASVVPCSFVNPVSKKKRQRIN
jgi:epoxyqueuosine reductase QueG